MYDVFLSYRRATGTEFCSFLRQVLTEEGYDVFFDYDSLRQGPFDIQIDRAIAECTYFMVILTPYDLDKCLDDPVNDWILHEVGLAQELGKIIIPISIKRNFSFPENHSNKVLTLLSKEQLCDLSGPNAATLIRSRLFDFMHDSSASRLKSEYNQGLLSEDYQKWEIQTLLNIYDDCSLLREMGRTYPVVVLEASKKVIYPFDLLNKPENLLDTEPCLDYQHSEFYHDFRKVVGPNIHFPDLYGFAQEGIKLDDEGKVEGFIARPRTYKETVYTSHILHYELWRTFQILGKNHPAGLEDLPLRQAIHTNRTNQEVLLTGCNRSCLIDVCVAVLAYDNIDNEYEVALATRSANVACHPGYLSIVPSGGFELYELEIKQDDYNIHKNFSICAALYREYIEELFGDEEFEKATGDDDLKRLYRNEHIKALRNGMGKTYFFEFLGVTLDLTSLRPTFSFVLRIDDPDFMYDNQIKKNQENIDVRFISLSQFEEAVKANENKSPLLPESAGVYALLKKNHLYQEAMDVPQH